MSVRLYELVGTQLRLFTTFHVFFFQFIYVLPVRHVPMRNFTGKLKQTQAVYSLYIFDVVLHYQLNAFKIPKMV